jgi:hypothetical protein
VLVWAKGKFGGILESIQNKWTSLVGEDGIVGVIWNPIKSAVDWVKTLFADPAEALSQMWTGFMGTLASIADILYAPVNNAIDWIAKKFGWRDEDAPPFSIQDTHSRMGRWSRRVGKKHIFILTISIRHQK